MYKESKTNNSELSFQKTTNQQKSTTSPINNTNNYNKYKYSNIAHNNYNNNKHDNINNISESINSNYNKNMKKIEEYLENKILENPNLLSLNITKDPEGIFQKVFALSAARKISPEKLNNLLSEVIKDTHFYCQDNGLLDTYNEIIIIVGRSW
ncbi:MAG: hypothetical protein ACRC1M_02630 [Methanobacteriaceae archaeon]